ncbi:MAG: 50S ribosomal protein L13 [Bacteroidales bacterium]|nr:50S ribosomal protein L13 [Bacteroidales bacterium]
MDTLSYKTKSANKDTVTKDWYVIDATNLVLGRLSSEVAKILRGKKKPDFTPHVDCGDNVIVINADKIKLTGNKWAEKKYIRHTGYPGGQRIEMASGALKKHPERIIENAVKGMLPHNRLGRAIFHNLFVYSGSEHPHAAQQPKELKLNEIK